MHVTKRFHSEELEMNMTPMIDVVFLLIVFFLVVSEIVSYDHIDNLTLPIANAAVEERKMPDRLVISIDTDNNVFVAGQPRSLKDVERLLKIEKQKHGTGPTRKTGQPVLIQADRHADWKTVQDIIETANKLKFWRLSFAVKMGS
jgi:biopolymer transport protein ExbD